jgi:protein-S-isoprenylcysteine O-methyltransferase Ste14
VVREFHQSLKSRIKAEATDRHSLVVIRPCIVAAWLLAAVTSSAVLAATIHGGVVEFAAGVGIAWLEIGLRWWAFNTLGRLLTFTVMTSPDQPVISNGPYRALRHPAYTGARLTLIGLGVM